MSTTVMEQQQKWLLRKFHTLCTRNGLDSETKLAMLSGYGVESSKDLSNSELMELCARLDDMANPEAEKLNKLRKRVIASIGGWLREIGKEDEGMEYIKGIACRAAGIDNFNKISAERLGNIYNMFLKKQKDAKGVNRVCGQIAYEVRFGKEPLLN